MAVPFLKLRMKNTFLRKEDEFILFTRSGNCVTCQRGMADGQLGG